MQEFHVAVNCVSLGLTEEYLQGHFPDSTSIKQSAEMMKVFDPSIKLTEPDKISNALLFLCSPLGISVTGQHLVLT
jgi:3-oxoacyl-[acyl-carrier protein] reductase